MTNPFCPSLGMFLRDYFAAHAPAEPFPWWRPNVPKLPAAPETSVRIASVHFGDRNDKRYQFWDCFTDDRGSDAVPDQQYREELAKTSDGRVVVTDKQFEEVKAFIEAWQVHTREKQKWEVDSQAHAEQEQRERVLQWPWAWADMMLTQRHIQPQPAKSIGDIEEGEIVRLKEPANPSPGECMVVSLNFYDPSRPALVLVPYADLGKKGALTFKSDPALWTHAPVVEQNAFDTLMKAVKSVLSEAGDYTPYDEEVTAMNSIRDESLSKLKQAVAQIEKKSGIGRVIDVTA